MRTQNLFVLLLVCSLAFCSCNSGDDPQPGGGNATSKTSVTMTTENITSKSVTCNITVSTSNNIYVVGVSYKPTDGTLSNADAQSASSSTSVTLENLKANTLYTITPYVFTDGNDNYIYGEAIQITTQSDPEYTLVFQDEFETAGQPDSHWGYETGQSIRNNEAQYYSNDIENAYCANGYLHIVGRKDHNGYSYTSASLITRYSFVFCYGRVEVRAKIPTDGGAWPAIWTLGNEYNWPSNGECDIMEYYTGGIMANACWGSARPWQGIWDSSRTPMSHFLEQDANWKDKFHTWVMDWDEDHIRLYLDDELLNEINLSLTFNQGGYQGNTENPYRYHKDGWGAYLLVNLALGGNNGGTIDDSAFPMEYLIDYVRIYQKERLPK